MAGEKTMLDPQGDRVVSSQQEVLRMNSLIRKALGANAIRRRVAGGTPADTRRAFWDCRFTKLEMALLLTVIALAGALHLSPVLHSGLGTILTYALPAICYLSPVTGFFFIACSQFVPFPEGSPHNPAQAGALVWLPIILLRYHRLNLNGVWRLWPVLPLLVWVMILSGEFILFPGSEYFKALVYAIIACQLANEARGRFLKCLFGLCLGALLVMSAYWASQCGLPVEINDWGGEREGFTRMGGVRTDSVMVWPALLLGISGLLGLQIAFASRRSPCPSPAWLTYSTIALCVASMPALVSTMSHGAFAGLALVVAALIWAGFMAGKEGAFASARSRLLVRWGMAGMALIIAFYVFDIFQLHTKVTKLDEYYRGVSKESSAAASRTGVWHDSINTIMEYPVLGILVTGKHEKITSDYAEEGSYLSHNVFLDYGRETGLPGMLMVAFFFFYPAIKMWRSGERVRYFPFLLALFAMLVFWMSLSFQFYKTFWGLWMLMAMAVPQVGPHVRKLRPESGYNTIRRLQRSAIPR
jgi:O-antigen ligase